MVGVYFSGTGNTKYCIENFLQEYNPQIQLFSIEEANCILQIKEHTEIIIAYPVQFSNIPKIVREFIVSNSTIWKQKRIFVIATMGLFSGDGSGVLARLLKSYGAIIVGGLHLKMPDSVSDKKLLKRTLDDNHRLIVNAKLKIKKAVHDLQDGCPPQEGIGWMYHLAGLFGQRLCFYNKTRNYSEKLKIDDSKCVGCGKCVNLCPMKNIHLCKGSAVPGKSCTMCYRCISRCPMQAITLLGREVISQNYIEKYIGD